MDSFSSSSAAAAAAVNSLTPDFFNFTKICSTCNGDMKTFKIPLSAYNKNGQCILTEKEKEKFDFVCMVCGSHNPLNFLSICNKYSTNFKK